jgi:hypothetical protein
MGGRTSSFSFLSFPVPVVLLFRSDYFGSNRATTYLGLIYLQKDYSCNQMTNNMLWMVKNDSNSCNTTWVFHHFYKLGKVQDNGPHIKKALFLVRFFPMVPGSPIIRCKSTV